tara:strand:- start:199 stop:330 length:132 start_codon:yes stop_codon:yes gene_type:complete
MFFLQQFNLEKVHLKRSNDRMPLYYHARITDASIILQGSIFVE